MIKKKYLIYFAGFLVCVNVLAWQQVFVLSQTRDLFVDFFNVGQGDSAFIQTPQGHQILIDGGPDSSVLNGLARVMPFWDREIDLIILTHPEKDHMQGLLEVLNRYRVNYILWNKVKKDSPEYKKWVSLIEEKKKNKNFLASISGKNVLQEVLAESGIKIKAGDVGIDILYPFESMGGKEIRASANDTCVVAKLIYLNKSFLFTGDISEKLEKEIINSGENINADILKVAHHGSKYSSSEDFLSSVNPEYAVISVGKNSYGHPTEEVLQRLTKYGIKIFRTDKDGDVKFVSDGNTIYLK